MAVINTNVSSLIAQRVLGKNNKQLNQSLQRLSTGLKINSGADNPAGLIASENLRAEQTGIKSALSNAERAGNIVATAEGGLGEVSNLLNEVQGLVTETANSGGLSKEEIDANQQQVDSILSTINRLSGSVNFQGKKLLNGELDYQKSGADLADLNNVRVNSAKLTAATPRPSTLPSPAPPRPRSQPSPAPPARPPAATSWRSPATAAPSSSASSAPPPAPRSSTPSTPSRTRPASAPSPAAGSTSSAPSTAPRSSPASRPSAATRASRSATTATTRS